MDLYSVPSLGHAHSLYTTYHTLICSIAIRFHQYTALDLRESTVSSYVSLTRNYVYSTARFVTQENELTMLRMFPSSTVYW